MEIVHQLIDGIILIVNLCFFFLRNFDSQVSYDNTLQSSQDPSEIDKHSNEVICSYCQIVTSEQLMVVSSAFISLATTVVNIPAVIMPIACSIKTWDICGIMLCHRNCTFQSGKLAVSIILAKTCLLTNCAQKCKKVLIQLKMFIFVQCRTPEHAGNPQLW